MGAPKRQRRSVERYSIVKRVRGGLARRYGINQKTVAKWKRRASVADLPTGPKEPRSTVLSIEEEADIVAFRRYTLLPLFRAVRTELRDIISTHIWKPATYPE